CHRLLDAYREEFKPKKDEKKDESNDHDQKNGDEKKDSSKENSKDKSDVNHNSQNGNGNEKEEKPEPPRRALPAPFNSPPFPTAEYQGFPLIGVPVSETEYPLMKAIYGGPYGEQIRESRIKAYGWFNASGNWSTARNSNTPDSYWVAPNH